MGVSTEGFNDCRPSVCRRFNERTPNAPQVRYFSYAGEVPLHKVTPMLRRAWDLLTAAEGPNDGLVSVSSARWGEFLGTIYADHFARPRMACLFTRARRSTAFPSFCICQDLAARLLRAYWPTARAAAQSYNSGSVPVLPIKGARAMQRCAATEAILAAKQRKGLTFEAIARAVGRHKVWVTAALLGQATMSAEEAGKAVGAARPGAGRGRRPAGDSHQGLGRPDRAGRSAHLPLSRDHTGLRHDDQGDHPRDVRRRHHERHRLRAGHPEEGRPEGRPGRRDHERQVLAVQEVVRAETPGEPGLRTEGTTDRTDNTDKRRDAFGSPSGHSVSKPDRRILPEGNASHHYPCYP